MLTFIKIAWRNIRRNRPRSTITISAVAVGFASLIFLKGFVDGADRQMVSNYTDLLVGHIQVHRTEKSINNVETVASSLRPIPDIVAYAPRVKEFALASSAESSSGVLLLGIDPVSEKKVSGLHRRLRAGRFLRKGEDDKIIIGKQLAKDLKVGLEDKVVIMSQASDGSVAAAAYGVAGIIEVGAEEIDKDLCLITLKAAQDLLVLGEKVSEVVVKVASLEKIDAVVELLKIKIDPKKFEVLGWKEISPITYQWLQFDQVFTGLILLIVLLVVASGILNTILMSVVERTREFGIMLALGTKPDQIVFMVATESFLLGLIGVILGGLAGGTALIFFAIYGVNLSGISHALNSFYIGPVIYTRLDELTIGFYASIVLLISIGVSLFPATKASRLSPIEAIRQI